MERRAIEVRGIVQGVGFRPFVYTLANRLGLHGFVRNQSGSVLIQVEGPPSSLDCFLSELASHPPPLAQIEHLHWKPLLPKGEAGFRIEHSESDSTSPVFISPDVAPCADCLRELFDPGDRRYRYPFLNCTNCGPRLTIITGAPYDRPQTTMASFPMCPACRAEYDNPADRRFHAQPIACPACGPRLQLLDGQGTPVPSDDPLADLVAAIQAGRIGALKGVGGYHLVCDATDPLVVGRLRSRKHREEKPFAIMVADLAAALRLAQVSDAERQLLTSTQAPIVLLRRRQSCRLAEPVAPGNPWIGVMLPSTPLHHLLLRAVGELPLVMTSGNRSDEPTAYRDEEAIAQLAGIADLFLTHNRPINVRCDDSVTRIVLDQEKPIRRSRGYAPRPITLPAECPCPILAVGGQLKGTFALGRARQAFLSHHLGDLDHYQAYRAFEKDIALYQQLFAIKPQLIAHDAHPDYASSGYARQQAARAGIPLLAVQHHHAHMAACMAEHGLTEPVIGVTFDGTGLGTNGAIWGGEFLVGDYRHFRRAAHLRYVGMPGGEQAIHEPWRMALAHLADAGVHSPALEARLSALERRTLATMLARGFNTPLTSSVGRLFDAVAALVGVRDRVSHEGQAAIELEWLACEVAKNEIYPFDLTRSQEDNAPSSPLVIDTRPLIVAITEDARRGAEAAEIARRFHASVCEMIGVVCRQLRTETGLEAVVLSGGVFMNTLLTAQTSARLQRDGFRVYRHRLVPANDGGLCLGQLAIAAAHRCSLGKGGQDVPGHSRQGGLDLPRA
jgi:hydrogenase maturation protein HypF